MGNFEGSRGVGAGKTVWEDGVWDAHKFDVDNADTSLKDKSRYTLLFEASRELGKAESTARREATELFYFKRADRRCLKQSCWADCREGVTDFELETRLEDTGDLEVFDKMVVRKIEVQNIGVKDGEAIILESSRVPLAGAISSGSDNQIEGLLALMKDEPMGISVSLQETEEVTKALRPLSVTLLLVAKASTVFDEELREKNQLIDRNTSIDIRNRLMPSITQGQGSACMIMIHNDKFTWITSVLIENEPLSIANSLFTLVELVDNASGRERCTVTTCAGMAEPKNWQKAIKMVVQEVRRWKNLCVTKCELIYYMGAPLKDMKHLAATLYILEMMNGNFLEEEMEFCNLDCLETIIAARKSGSKNEFSLILLRTSPSSLHFQQVFLKDIDNQGSTYIIGPAREPWDFTMEGKDQWYAVVILVVDEAQLHFDEENDTYKDLQMRRCCPPLLYGRTIWLMVLVINANIVQDSFVLSYNISFELSLVDRLKLGSLVHLQTHVLLKVLIRWLLTWIDKICDLIVIEGV
ncbi:hypothetical protein V6N11_039252 [Hibiscus sabdariffa]|uniref:Uncharacterized protein n=1 Tax=Hibiscus sabdariffa TaxID=183260 RepID=A0ABR2SMD2_9ROSI